MWADPGMVDDVGGLEDLSLVEEAQPAGVVDGQPEVQVDRVLTQGMERGLKSMARSSHKHKYGVGAHFQN